MLSIIWMPSMTGVIVALCVYGLVGKLALDPVLVALVADSVDETNYSTAFGLFNFIGMSSSILAPIIAGAARDITGSLASSFFMFPRRCWSLVWSPCCFFKRKKRT
ncbi:hypothetical protein ABR759_00605 [Escherichia coli]